MIKTFKGDILSIKEGFIVHSCNQKPGVMGGGLALQIRKKYPEANRVYSQHHKEMGSITTVEVEPFKYIVNGIGQKHVGVGRQTSYDALVEVFERTHEFHQFIEDKSGINLPICFPLIGCGLGGGAWKIIEQIIEDTIPEGIEKHLYVL